MSETLTLVLDETQTSAAAVEKRVHGLGYTAAALATASRDSTTHPEARGGGHDHARDVSSHDHGPQQHGDACCSADDSGHGHDHSRHDHAGHDHAAHRKSDKAPERSQADHGHGLPGHVHEVTPEGASWYQTGKGRLVLVTGALLGAAWIIGSVRHDIAYWAFLVACLVGVAPVARRALAAARAGIPFTIEMLMTIAAIGALFIGAAEEAALVVFLFAVGEVLEGVAADRARASIRALGDLVPKTALIEENGATRQVDAASLAIGQVVLVRPGDRIPADGEILDGVSGIDESPVQI